MTHLVKGDSLTRTPESGWFGGLCAGIAQHYQLSPSLVRLLFLGLTAATGFFPATALYILLLFLIPIQQRQQPQSPTSLDTQGCEQALEAIEKRTAKLEAYLSSTEFEIDCRVKEP